MSAAVMAAAIVCAGVGCAPEEPEEESVGKVNVGIVAFNGDINSFALSNNLSDAKRFLTQLGQGSVDKALCYGVSKASTLLLSDKLSKLDNIFMVTFTGGADNCSSRLYQPVVDQYSVYDRAADDLSPLTQYGIKYYTIALSPVASANFDDVQKIFPSASLAISTQLESNFKDTSKKIQASARHFTLETPQAVFSDAHPKYFELTAVISSATDYSGWSENQTLECQLKSGNRFEVQVINSHLTFTPSYGSVKDKRIYVPLSNLKYIGDVSTAEYYIKNITVKVKYESGDNYTSEPASSVSSEMSKVGVVFVLDSSKSPNPAENAVFFSLKRFIQNFIDDLEKAANSKKR